MRQCFIWSESNGIGVQVIQLNPPFGLVYKNLQASNLHLTQLKRIVLIYSVINTLAGRLVV